MLKSYFLASSLLFFLLLSPYGYANKIPDFAFRCKASASSLGENLLFKPADFKNFKLFEDDLLQIDIIEKAIDLSNSGELEWAKIISSVRQGGYLSLVKSSSDLFVLKSIYNSASLKNDVLAFEIMKLFFKDNPDIPIRLIEYTHIPKIGFKQEYIPGKTMSQIGYTFEQTNSDLLQELKLRPVKMRILGSDVPLDLAENAYQLYSLFQIRFGQWVEKLFPNRIESSERYQMFLLPLKDIKYREEAKQILELGKKNSLQKYNPFYSPIISVFPHSNNILIDARDGSLVLIDPY